ncbi:helix-turn-helix domain-containing protein [Streptomyces bobili]|uniref:helix-turn-helix domain-containing protein n=1 Tax=Streptomyces bobili TaxID=67280 RepID=UPI003660E1C9
MPPRAAPSERQKRLGAELRKMRLAARASTEYAAGLLGVDRAKISNVESGVRIITPDRLRTLAIAYACTDDDYVDALVAMAEDKERGWWEEYRGTLPAGMLDVAELEWHATQVRTVQFVHLPALLQIEDYARGIFNATVPKLSPLRVEQGIAHRMARQKIFDRPDPVPYLAYIHEAALRMRFGGSKATRQQLIHLAEHSEQDGIDVRIISTTVNDFPGAGHALLYADGTVPPLDTVQLDSAIGPVFTAADDQLAKYRTHLDWMDKAALSPAASRDLILTVAREI